MHTKTVTIPAISCHHCVHAITTEALEITGVTSATGDPELKQVTFEWDEPATWNAIQTMLDEIGYSPGE